MTRLAEVVAAAVALLESQGDATDPDQLSDEQLEQLAGGRLVMEEITAWDAHGVLPTSVEALTVLGEMMERSEPEGITRD